MPCNNHQARNGDLLFPSSLHPSPPLPAPFPSAPLSPPSLSLSLPSSFLPFLCLTHQSDFDFGLSSDEEGDARSRATQSTTPRAGSGGKKGGGGSTPGSQASGGKGAKKPPKARASSTHEVAAKVGAAFDKALKEATAKQPAEKKAPAKKRRL